MPTEKRYIVTVVLPAPHEREFAEAEMCVLRRLADAGGYKVLSEFKAFEVKGTRDEDIPTFRDVLLSDFDKLGLKADLCVQNADSPRRKKLLICDMDSTLIGQECIDELADFAGVGEYVAGITERAMRGELDFESALTERVGLLKDLPLSKLQQTFDERITLNKGADILAKTMAKQGSTTLIVSGGFTFFSERVAKAAGFVHHQANILLDDGKALTGTVQMPILGREAKREALEQFAEPHGGAENAIAIGDGANDLAMITAAGLGVAYRAKPAVAAAAQCAINHTDLTSALYFQGYQDSEFVRP